MRLQLCEMGDLFYCWDPEDPMNEIHPGNIMPDSADGVGDSVSEAIGSAIQNILEGTDSPLVIEGIERVNTETETDKPSIDQFIPSGFEFVRLGNGKKGDLFLGMNGCISVLEGDDTGNRNKVIVKRKFQKTTTEPLKPWVVVREVEVTAPNQVEAARAGKHLMEKTVCVNYYVHEPARPLEGVDIDLTVDLLREARVNDQR